MAQGEELLIADTTERDRSGLRNVFEAEGFVCTVASGPEQARDLLRRKFFPVALIGLTILVSMYVFLLATSEPEEMLY